MIQKSYDKSEFGNLYLVPSPIGNLEDITLRSINTLKNVDMIYAEDTRETYKLLSYYKINKKIESCHKYTEMKNKDKIISLLKEGKNIAYLTDRGTPLISDPGNIVVDEAINNGINVISLPGANALLPAINMSGISNEKFLFYGFLNSKKSIRNKELLNIKDIKQTIIFYESPYRLHDTLLSLFEIFGNRKASIIREISKLHEEIIRDSLQNLANTITEIKGEIVIVVEGNKEDKVIEVNYSNQIKELISKGLTKRDAIKKVAILNNISKNKIYNEFKEL